MRQAGPPPPPLDCIWLWRPRAVWTGGRRSFPPPCSDFGQRRQGCDESILIGKCDIKSHPVPFFVSTFKAIEIYLQQFCEVVACRLESGGSLWQKVEIAGLNFHVVKSFGVQFPSVEKLTEVTEGCSFDRDQILATAKAAAFHFQPGLGGRGGAGLKEIPVLCF